MRVLDAEYKLAKYVKISMLYLEDDDAVSAETYIKKASALLAACKVRRRVRGAPRPRQLPPAARARQLATPPCPAGGLRPHTAQEGAGRGATACEAAARRRPALVPQNDELSLQYKSCYARILDAKRRFLEAAQRYYELSQVGKRSEGSKTVRTRLSPPGGRPRQGRHMCRQSASPGKQPVRPGWLPGWPQAPLTHPPTPPPPPPPPPSSSACLPCASHL
jgi:hypothetical protein